MDSNLYLIEVDDPSKTFNELMEDHDLGLSIAIVDRIVYAIENKLSKVNIAIIDTGKITITLHASAPSYVETLETNIGNLIRYEEYELCARGKKALEKFKESREYIKSLAK